MLTREEKDLRIAKAEASAMAQQEAKKTKTVPVWVLQVNYGVYGNGWEDETWNFTRAGAVDEARTYRASCNYPVRVFLRRMKRSDVFPPGERHKPDNQEGVEVF